MKKFLAILLVALMVLGLAACGGKSSAPGSTTPAASGSSGSTAPAKADDGKVYTLDGRLVRTDGNLQQLQKGLYIINKKKVIVK